MAGSSVGNSGEIDRSEYTPWQRLLEPVCSRLAIQQPCWGSGGGLTVTGNSGGIASGHVRHEVRSSAATDIHVNSTLCQERGLSGRERSLYRLSVSLGDGGVQLAGEADPFPETVTKRSHALR